MSSHALADARRQSINIPADDLVASLELLAKQSGIEFVYDADQLKGVKAHGVSGILTPKEAVTKLLEGTHLTVTEHQSGALLIAAPQAGDRTSNSAPSPPQDAGSAARSAHRNSSRQPSVLDHAGSQDADANSKKNWDLDEIIVTGTHIRGEAAVGSALIVYTRTDIEQSGSATLDQFARQMPQNFSGADTIATANFNANIGGFQQGAAANIFGGAGFNLHGLGPGSTLTLLNGHRLAPGAFDGSLVDISQIPLSAVDRIEVLDDGASAIYGSDAVAGVVNIITRKDFDGVQTGVRYGASTEGGAREYTASQLLGRSWGTGNFLLNFEYDDQGGLDASQRNWIGGEGGPYSLIPENRRNSVFATGSEDIGSGTTLSASILYSDRDFETNSIIGVAGENEGQFSTGRAAESAATLSLERNLFGDWYANITGNYSSIRQLENTSTFALPANQLDVSMGQQLSANSDIAGIDALGSGSLFNLPGGALKASLGGSFRTEQFKSHEFAAGPVTPILLHRQAASAYGELLVPIFGSANAQPGVRHLEFSAAYRYDQYSDFGSTSNPKVGLSWEPLAGLSLRSTYGTSFQAPFLSQLGSPITSSTVLFPDGRSPSGQSDILEIGGGNPKLLPQRSKSITAGFDYKPSIEPNLAVSMTYFYVLFKNRIQAPHVTSQALLSQPLLLPFVSLNPSLADVQTYFSSPGFQGDNAGLGPNGIVAVLDDQLANLASTVESGLDFSARYSLPTAYGQFNFWVSGTHLLSDRIQSAVFTSWFDVDNTVGEPTSWKVRGGVGWARDGLGSGIAINYVNAYQNTLFTPSIRIGGWPTADFYLSYNTGAAASYLARNLKIVLSVQNLNDQRPPYLQIPAADLPPGQNPIPFDGTNASPVGRLISLQITKGW
jgi:outer membrane receptor protein involved in Fe transport